MAGMAKSAFVAGATGLTGRHVVERVLARGVAAVAHVRPDSPRIKEWRERFVGSGASVDDTPWEADAIARTIAERRPTEIFACLGTTRARAKETARAGGDASRESYDAVDVAMTEMLIAAARAAGSVERFVYLSSIGAGPGARGSYLEARTRVESTLEKSGVPYTIVRPSFIVGDRDVPRGGENVFGAVANAGLGVLGALGARTLRDRYRSISGADLAEAMVAIAGKSEWTDRVARGEDLQFMLGAP